MMKWKAAINKVYSYFEDSVPKVITFNIDKEYSVDQYMIHDNDPTITPMIETVLKQSGCIIWRTHTHGLGGGDEHTRRQEQINKAAEYCARYKYALDEHNAYRLVVTKLDDNYHVEQVWRAQVDKYSCPTVETRLYKDTCLHYIRMVDCVGDQEACVQQQLDIAQGIYKQHLVTVQDEIAANIAKEQVIQNMKNQLRIATDEEEI